VDSHRSIFRRQLLPVPISQPFESAHKYDEIGACIRLKDDVGLAKSEAAGRPEKTSLGETDERGAPRNLSNGRASAASITTSAWRPGRVVTDLGDALGLPPYKCVTRITRAGVGVSWSRVVSIRGGRAFSHLLLISLFGRTLEAWLLPNTTG